MYALNNNVNYFDSFGVKNIPKEIEIFIDKSIVVANESIMSGYFCIVFIDFMLAGKAITSFTNLFSPNNFKSNDDIILKYFVTNV